MLKVFVPSHKRPDAPLFKIAKGLNIVLQHEEDVEPYQKANVNNHNIIYIPELRGLLDARNWILDQPYEWILMMDDDASEIKKYGNKNNYSKKKFNYIITWDEFIIDLKKLVLILEKNKIGLAGFKSYTTFNENNLYFIDDQNLYNITTIKFFRAYLMNKYLLKSKNFKFEGYPDDGENGQKALCEDSDLLYWCSANSVKKAIINSHCPYYYEEQESTVWETHNYKKEMLRLAYIWLLNKYKDYPNIRKDIVQVLFYFHKDYYNERKRFR